MLDLLRAKLKINRLARNWRFWCDSIAKAAAAILGPCETYVFGSAAKGHLTGGSDVDILIVAEKLPNDFKLRGNLKAEIERVAKLPLYHPFEIHLVTRREAETNPIYRKAMKEGIALTTRKETL